MNKKTVASKNTQLVNEQHCHVVATSQCVNQPFLHEEFTVDMCIEPFKKIPTIRFFKDSILIAYGSYSYWFNKCTTDFFVYPVWQWTSQEYRNKGLQKSILELYVQLCEHNRIINRSLDGSIIEKIKIQYCSCWDNDNPMWRNFLIKKGAFPFDIKTVSGQQMLFTTIPSCKILSNIKNSKKTF